MTRNSSSWKPSRAPHKAKPVPAKTRSVSTKADYEAESIPLGLQQKCLDIFKDALKPTQDDQVVLQEVKGHLYNRDFAAAFGKEEYLRVYASRWSPSRALAYMQVFQDIDTHLDTDSEVGDGSLRVVCLGGGAGGELAALASGHSARLEDAGEGATGKLHVTLVDIAGWSGVLGGLTKSLTSPLELSKYASQAKRDSNKPFIDEESMAVDFQKQDVLNLDKQATVALAASVKHASLVTFMFTLNELYSTSVAKTQRLLAQLTDSMTPGSCLLVIDSPGSYSTVAINGVEKKYPMQWLLDHTLMPPPCRKEDAASRPRWEKMVSDDSRWFRLPEGLEYPIELENMRYQIHLYRRLSDVGG